MDEAKELLEKAKKSLINPPAANFYAIDALEKLKAAIDCLKALLG